MKHDHWKLFSWNLAALEDAPLPLPHGLQLRTATKSDESVIQALVSRAFSTDAQWTGSYSRIAASLQERLHEAFRSQHNPALTISHGPRIIAAACFSTDIEAENHLYCGPCVLPEYRSRGLGAALLLASLRTLKDLGVHVARAVVKDNTTASKFVYPKFSSVSEPYEGEPFESVR
jgi:predicted N-acetyltransferase YhbS